MLNQKFNLQLINNILSIHLLNDYVVKIFEELHSTNKYALDNSHQLDNRSVIVCEYQSSGHGRNGKSWAHTVNDIAVSVIYFLPPDVNYDLLPLVIAVAVNRMFKQNRISAKIKWPNDILMLDHRKVAGILIESKKIKDLRSIVIGVGINNVNHLDKNELLVSIIKHINNTFNEYQTFGFALLRQEWLDNCIHYNQIISLYRNKVLLDKGLHTDLTNDGKIKIRKIHTGEIMEYSGSTISLVVEEGQL